MSSSSANEAFGTRGDLNWPLGPPDDAPPTDGTHRRPVLFVVVGVVLLALAVVSLVSLTQALNANAKVADLQSQIATLSQEQAQIASTQAKVDSNFGSLPSELDALGTRITDVQQSVRAAGSSASEAIIAARQARVRADDIARCVNKYMKVVGDSRGGSYRYYFC